MRESSPDWESVNDSFMSSALLEEKDKWMIFKIDKKADVCDSSSWITFTSVENIEVWKFYAGLELAGKCIKVTSLQNLVSRYYTICNCMSWHFLDQYHDMIISLLEDTEFKWKFSSV